MTLLKLLNSILDRLLGPAIAHGDWLGGPDIEGSSSSITSASAKPEIMSTDEVDTPLRP